MSEVNLARLSAVRGRRGAVAVACRERVDAGRPIAHVAAEAGISRRCLAKCLIALRRQRAELWRPFRTK